MNNEEEIKNKRIEMLSALKSEAKLKNMSDKDIAEKTGLTERNIKRILFGRFPPTLDIYIAIRDAIKL